MANYKLTYFDARGLAEPSRLLFALAGVQYEDVRIPFTFGAKNEIPSEIKQKLTFGQVPFLEVGEEGISQSGTIQRYLARKFNLYGANDLEAAKISEIIDAHKDLGDSFRPFWMAKDAEAKEAAKKSIVEVSIPKYVGKFNEILEKNGTGYLVGKSVSLADVIIYNMVQSIEAMVQVDFTKDYPNIKKLHEKIGAIPQIKKWVEERPKTQF